MIGGLAETTPGREAAETAQSVAKREARSEAVSRAQNRHVMTAHVPSCHDERSNQSAGEYSACLQGIEAENLAPVIGVTAPVIDDVENFRADDPGENNQDAKVPGIVAVDALLFGVANADPESDQDSGGD